MAAAAGVDVLRGCRAGRHLELVHREGTGRYDMPLPWCIDGQAGDVTAYPRRMRPLLPERSTTRWTASRGPSSARCGP